MSDAEAVAFFEGAFYFGLPVGLALGAVLAKWLMVKSGLWVRRNGL